MARKSGTEIDSTAVKPSELKQALVKAVEADVPTFVHGSPGVGKSSIVAQVAKALGREFIDIRLSQRDPTDLMGLPLIDSGKLMDYARPKVLPNDPNSFGIMLLDELSSAVPLMQVAGYQLVLEKRVGDHVIQGEWFIMGAGNLDSDNAVTFGMSSALANRFLHLTLIPDVQDWCDWAIQAGVAPEVVGYMKMYPQALWEEPGDQKAFPTPRSWNRVSDLVKSPTQVPRGLELKMFAGCVGAGEAGKFENHLHRYRELPSLNDIIAKPSKTAVPNDPAAQYTIAVALAYRATMQNIASIVTYVQRMQPELQVLAVTSVLQRQKDNGIRGANSLAFDGLCKSLQVYFDIPG